MRELAGQRGRVLRLAVASVIGAVGGAVLLLTLDEDAFAAIVPVLILLGLTMVVLQPWITRSITARRERTGDHPSGETGSWWVWPLVLLTGVYGGYFGAAQGVLLIAILGLGLSDPLPRVNALKNVLAGIANGVAGLLFIVISEVNWWAAGAIAVGSVLGAQLGAVVGRRLTPIIYRVVIVLVGVVAIVSLLRPGP